MIVTPASHETDAPKTIQGRTAASKMKVPRTSVAATLLFRSLASATNNILTADKLEADITTDKSASPSPD